MSKIRVQCNTEIYFTFDSVASFPIIIENFGFISSLFMLVFSVDSWSGVVARMILKELLKK
jgi:hypothetical protein